MGFWLEAVRTEIPPNEQQELKILMWSVSENLLSYVFCTHTHAGKCVSFEVFVNTAHVLDELVLLKTSAAVSLIR